MAYLVLSNGMVFEGRRIGSPENRIGELVFTTGMEGYLETLTDPSYYGQIVTQTFPLIGNYGVIEEDFEGTSALFGYIVRELCGTPSNFRSSAPLNDYLTAKGIPGLCGVDTREIVRITREEGVMNAMICDEIPSDLSAIRAFTVRDAVDSVSSNDHYTCPAEGRELCRAALIDYGASSTLTINTTRCNVGSNKNTCFFHSESFKNFFTLILHYITMKGSRFVATQIKHTGYVIGIHFCHSKNKTVKIW